MTSSWSLKTRLLFLGFLLGFEVMAATLRFDGATLQGTPGAFTSLLRDWGPSVLRFLVGTVAVLLTFSFLTKPGEVQRMSASIPGMRVSPLWLAVNVAACVAFAGLAGSIYGNTGSSEDHNLLSAGVLLSGALGIASALLAALPLSQWIRLAGVLGRLWGYSVGTVFLALWASNITHSLWEPVSRLTFQLVQWMLAPFVDGLIAEPVRLRIATPKFGVIIAPECSGLEGIGLLLLFGALWLWLFRKDCRFPQALLLLPAGVVALFLLNSARIATLLVIGHFGAREIAMQGFHSQAGWISFNAVAFGLCVTARRVSWISRLQPHSSSSVVTNSVTPYVGPFLTVLAAGMLVRAMTGSFEWLYPLKFLAGLAALWTFRNVYRNWNWTFGWEGPATGAAAFFLWVALDRWLFGWSDAPMPAALDHAPPVVRAAWIAIRAISASTMVPVVEELAFRGCLLRRFITEEFDSLPLTSYSWLSLTLSSVIFGGLHGARWVAGIAVGLLYAAVLVRKGRLGDAVLAHATTNALLAGYVLFSGAWQFW